MLCLLSKVSSLIKSNYLPILLVLSNICRKKRICWWLLSSQTHGSKSHGVFNTAVQLYITSLAFLISKMAIWWLLFFTWNPLTSSCQNHTLSYCLYIIEKTEELLGEEHCLSYLSSYSATYFCSYDLCLPFSSLWKKCFHWHQSQTLRLCARVPFPIDSARTIYLKFYTFPQYSQFIPVSWMISISMHTYCKITYICLCMSSWELHILLAVFFASSMCAFPM